jgi:hypothetical protein
MAAMKRFASDHEVKTASWAGENVRKDTESQFAIIDYKEPSQIQSVVEGTDAILYSDDSELSNPEVTEERRIEQATLAPYRLLQAAREAGVKRVVLASSLRLFDTYPEKYLIDEQWKPRPQPEASSLASYLTEQTCREFAREGPLPVIALRFDPAEIQEDVDIALSAVEKALALPLSVPGYQWQVFHISESDRYITRQARLRLGWTGKINKDY